MKAQPPISSWQKLLETVERWSDDGSITFENADPVTVNLWSPQPDELGRGIGFKTMKVLRQAVLDSVTEGEQAPALFNGWWTLSTALKVEAIRRPGTARKLVADLPDGDFKREVVTELVARELRS